MVYGDGDQEIFTQKQFFETLKQSNVPVGSVGYKFVKKFGRHFFDGTVTKVLSNGKLQCTFSDGDVHNYTTKQV